MGMGGMIDFLFLISGVYLMGTAINAKTQGNISSNVMLSKDTSEKDIEDKAGFINYMYKRVLLAGILIVVAAVVHMINDYYFVSRILTWVGIVIILAALIIYSTAYKHGQKLYMAGYVENRSAKKQKKNKNK